MKQLATLTGIACLLLVTRYAAGQHNKEKGVVNIIRVRQKQEPPQDLAHHKYHDVVVCKEGDYYYDVYFYSNFGDTLFRYKASYGSNDDLDKASYKWVNDTLVNICLYSTHSKKQIKFGLFGNKTADGKKVTGMMRDD